jgi:hypothetical protein
MLRYMNFDNILTYYLIAQLFTIYLFYIYIDMNIYFTLLKFLKHILMILNIHIPNTY